jgi:hypothetical protein
MTPPGERPEPGSDNNDGANIAAVIFIVILVAASVWLINKLTNANDKLNCIASGRTNCADLSR